MLTIINDSHVYIIYTSITYTGVDPNNSLGRDFKTEKVKDRERERGGRADRQTEEIEGRDRDLRGVNWGRRRG